ncbi:MAG: cutinase family protein [Gordonia sp. (in: high G+C Gram-positive bacteria)]|uniref:cutinase family protein n=1 Tax=Gordonia sp. (in: high G+C Gram-positive bacteria) TaxID=84139 RepID=UPI0039E63494
MRSYHPHTPHQPPITPSGTFPHQHPAPPTPPGPTRRFSKKILIFGGAGLAVLLVLLIGIVAGTGTSTNCADVVFIGAAGSGQRTNPGENGDIGREMYQTWLNLKADADAAGLSAELRPVEYPADEVPFLETAKIALDVYKKNQFDPSPLKPYFESISAGADATTEEIKGALRCRDSKIVVAGYSQGAMAVHRALHRVDPDEKIVAGVMVGDGDRLPQSQDPYVGTYQKSDTPKKSRGIAQYSGFTSFSGASPEPFSAEWADRLGSACSDGDPVCAFAWFSFNEVSELNAHTSYDPADWRLFIRERITR